MGFAVQWWETLREVTKDLQRTQSPRIGSIVNIVHRFGLIYLFLLLVGFGVDLSLCFIGDTQQGHVLFEVRQPILFEPELGFVPTLSESNDRFESYSPCENDKLTIVRS